MSLHSKCNWAVAGGAGFIGRHVCRAVHRRGDVAHVLDRVAVEGPHTVVDLDAPSLAEVLGALAPDILVHAAGPASVRDSFVDPVRDFRGTVLPWLAVLDAARRAPAPPKLVLVSSAAVYGEPVSLPVAEQAPRVPLSPYGHHKVICEQLADEYARLFGLRILVVRVFSVYGPGQRRLLLWELFRQATNPAPTVKLLGTGRETRDYLHIDDLSAILVEASLADWTGLRVLNLASGISVSTRQLAELVLSSAGTRKPIEVSDSTPAGDPPHWQADVSALRRVVSTTPRPLIEGVSCCVTAWLRS